MENLKKMTFKRKYSKKIAALGMVLFLVFGIVLGILFYLRGHPGDKRDSIVFIFIFTLFIAPLTVNTILFQSDIVVSDQIIGVALFGISWKTLEWKDVKRIRMMSFVVPYKRDLAKVYHIDTSLRRRDFLTKKGMSLDKEIVDFENLKKIVNNAVRLYNITVINADNNSILKEID